MIRYHVGRYQLAPRKGHPMNGKPISELGDVKLTARAYNLGLKLVPNLQHILTLERLEFFESNLRELPFALRFGFERPRGDVVKVHERGENLEVHLPLTTMKSADEWVAHFLARGITVYGGALSVLRGPQLQQTRGREYRVTIQRSLPSVVTLRRHCSSTPLLLEAACMLRDYLTNADMVALGLRRLIVAHPVSPSGKLLALEVGAERAILNAVPADLKGVRTEGVGVAFA